MAIAAAAATAAANASAPSVARLHPLKGLIRPNVSQLVFHLSKLPAAQGPVRPGPATGPTRPWGY